MYFNPEYAKKYGLEEAIVLQNFIFWIGHNRANQKNIHDGKTWTFNSYRALSALFPFWSESKIKRIIWSLEEQGVLIAGRFNKMDWDRTKWYALVNEEEFLSGEITAIPKVEDALDKLDHADRTMEKTQLTHPKDNPDQTEGTKMSHGRDTSDQTIPYINTDIKPDSKTEDSKTETSSSESVVGLEVSSLLQDEEIISIFNEKNTTTSSSHSEESSVPVSNDDDWTSEDRDSSLPLDRISHLTVQGQKKAKEHWHKFEKPSIESRLHPRCWCMREFERVINHLQ